MGAAALLQEWSRALLTIYEDALLQCYQKWSRNAEAQSSFRLSHQERQTLLAESRNRSAMS